MTAPWAWRVWVDLCVLIAPAPGRQGPPRLRLQPHHRLKTKHGARKAWAARRRPSPAHSPPRHPTRPPSALAFPPTPPLPHYPVFTMHFRDGPRRRRFGALPLKSPRRCRADAPAAITTPPRCRSPQPARCGGPPRPPSRRCLPSPLSPPRPPLTTLRTQCRAPTQPALLWAVPAAAALPPGPPPSPPAWRPDHAAHEAAAAPWNEASCRWAGALPGGGRPGRLGMCGARRLPPGLCFPASSPA